MVYTRHIQSVSSETIIYNDLESILNRLQTIPRSTKISVTFVEKRSGGTTSSVRVMPAKEIIPYLNQFFNQGQEYVNGGSEKVTYLPGKEHSLMTAYSSRTTNLKSSDKNDYETKSALLTYMVKKNP